MVDHIRIGERGYALVVAPDGALVAHGDPDKKALVAQSRNMSGHPLVARSATAERRRRPSTSTRTGASSSPSPRRIAPLGWTVIVEQPTSEAYASATRAAAAAHGRHRRRAARDDRASACSSAAASSPRSSRCSAATQAVAAGDLDDARRHPHRRRVRRARRRLQHHGRPARRAAGERQAAGAAGDVRPRSPPASSTTCRIRSRTSATARACCCATTSTPSRAKRSTGPSSASSRRSSGSWTTCATSSSRSRSSASRWTSTASVAEIVDAMRAEGERHGVAVEAQLRRRARWSSTAIASRSAACYRNLITNAHSGDRAGRARRRSTTARAGDHVRDQRHRHRIGHSGRRLSAIFDDFVTTKRRGLGLGLAISKRIVEQLDGTIIGRERSGTRHVVHAAVPGPRRPCRRKPRQVESAADAGRTRGGAMFRTLVKTDAIDGRGPDVSGPVLRAADAAGRAALQRRDSARRRATASSWTTTR